ncbi:MAG: iron-containing alcohol dehydrogenase [Desulfatiglandales bacterium]
MAKRRIYVEGVKRTLFGIGSIEELGERLRRLGMGKVLLVMDRELGKGPLRERVSEILEGSSIRYGLYAEVTPEPSPWVADKGAEMGRDLQVQGIVGVGGGSTLDVAKAIAVLVTNRGKAEDYIGLDLVPNPGIPSVMVPTTAGTGSEATFTAVFTMREQKKKGGINSPYLYPELAILDPELTLELPPYITAFTGMDALVHAIESYTSKAAHFLSRPISWEAIQILGQNLRGAVYNGKDIHARSNMLKGSYLAGLGLAMAGVGLVHAMAYPLGALYDIPHGVANGVMLPYVLEYNYPAKMVEYAEISWSLGTEAEGEREAASLLPERCFELLQDIGMPPSLKELGIPREDLPKMAEIAMGVTRPIQNNPRPVDTEAIIRIYENAFEG